MRNRLNNFCLMVLFLLVLMGCHKQDPLASFIGIAKLDINSDMAKEVCYLDMYVFSGTDYQKIEIEETEEIKSIEYQRYDILLNDRDYQSNGYLHKYVIRFYYEPIYITKLTFKSNEMVKDWSIGRYSSQKFVPTCEDVTTNIVIVKDTNESNSYQLNLLVYNQDSRTFYLNVMEAVAKHTSHDLSISTFPVSLSQIPPTNLQVYQNMKLAFSQKYFQVESVIKLDFFTNLRKEKLYASYYVSRLPSINTLQKEGIEINTLEHVSFMQ